MNDDDRMKEAFANLRRHDERRAPAFAALRAATTRSRARWIVALPVGVTALAAAAAVAIFVTASRDADAPTASAPAYAPVAFDPAPLDFLLATPGRTSLASAPNFDTSLLPGRRR
jgi:hypothetical protein